MFTYVLIVEKAKVKKKKRKLKLWRIMDDIKKQLEIVFSEDTSNSAANNWK